MNETLPLNLVDNAINIEEVECLHEYQREIAALQSCVKRPSEDVMLYIYDKIEQLSTINY